MKLPRHLLWTIFVVWFAGLVLLLLLLGCARRDIVQPVRIERRTIIRIVPCLTMPPPAPIASDATNGEKADAYDRLRVYLELYAWPICAEQRATVAIDP